MIIPKGAGGARAPTEAADGSLFFAAGGTRPNRSFSAIELKASDGDSWYNAMVVELRRASSQLGFQVAYTLARNIEARWRKEDMARKIRRA